MQSQVRQRQPNIRPMSQNRPITHVANGQRNGQGANVARSYSYNSKVGRNAQSDQPASQTTQQALVVDGQEDLTSTMLAAANAQEQKQMLGERLFPLISTMHSDLAGKITGMLLEIDNSELLHMLESKESLKAKVYK